MNDEVITQILQRYGVQPTRLLEMQKGYRNESHPAVLNDGRRVNLIIYKSEPGIVDRIRRANVVADYLAARGFPARQTIDRRLIRLAAGARQKYAALYTYLSGTTIPWEAYRMEHIKLLGQTMSDMHAVLRDVPTSAQQDVADEYVRILKKMHTYFADPQIANALQAKRNLTVHTMAIKRLEKLVQACKRLPGQQTLHMDFVRGNILFDHSDDKPRVTGILDFEKTACGHPLFDIARTLAFLIVDCKYKSEDKVRKYFLYSGYKKRGKGSFRSVAISNEIRYGMPSSVFENLVDLFLLYDFYKFLKHNPYEYLAQNEHYRRTEDILLKRTLYISKAEVTSGQLHPMCL